MKLNDLLFMGILQVRLNSQNLISYLLVRGVYGIGKTRLDLSHRELEGRWCPTVADPGFLVAGCRPIGVGAPTTDVGTFQQKHV